jgi:anion-transporting  ArsA/GET3 family ATPase
MVETVQNPTPFLAKGAAPRILFVFGKGGVGRSTVAAAVGLLLAERGERVLIVEWAVADTIGPWFGAVPVGPTYVEIAPRLDVTNFALDEALRAYFVDHLRVELIYRRVIRARPVARLLDVAPGLAEMFFLGQLWWLTTLAEREAQLHFDRIIVDAPATGHGVSLLDLPSTVGAMGTAGLLAVETRRVADMLADPAQTGAVVVSLPEPLVVDETLELMPRVTARLGHPPVAVIINRSVAAIATDDTRPAWLDTLAASAHARAALGSMHDELRAHASIERELRSRLEVGTVISVADQPGRAPLDVVRATARTFAEAR